MFNIRTFRNTDPPHIAEIWKSQPPQRGLMQPMSPNLLELCVFSKQYFDHEGLIVATKDNVPIGFAHGGFGPNESGGGLDTELGVTQMVMLHGAANYPRLADELLRVCEQHLRERGASVLYGGGIDPLNPFYLGLYGGSELPGVLDSDVKQKELFARNHYQESSRILIMQRDLVRFRPPITRTQRQLKREMLVEYDPLPSPADWYSAVQTCGSDELEFTLVRRRDDAVLARAAFWDLEPLSTSWGIRTAGLRHIEVEKAYRRSGLASYLLSEAFNDLQKRGISMVEAHTMQDNFAAIALYKKLGFTQVDAGTVMRREATG